MKKLISMVDFVLEHPASTDYEWQLKNHLNYANFLKQPLKLEMFVPCDDDGNVLDEPNNLAPNCGCMGICNNPCDEAINIEIYENAKEKVLFDGFYISKDYITNCILQIDDEWIQDKTIEDLIPYNLELKQQLVL